MSNWTPITLANLYAAKMAIIVDLCDSLLLKVGQANRSAELIGDVVREVRGAVASCKRNRLDADVTAVPTGLQALAGRRIIWALKDALEQDPTEVEKINFAADTAKLKAVASGDFVVEQPDNPLPSYTEEQVSYGVTSKAGKRQASRHKLDGL